MATSMSVTPYRIFVRDSFMNQIKDLKLRFSLDFIYGTEMFCIDHTLNKEFNRKNINLSLIHRDITSLHMMFLETYRQKLAHKFKALNYSDVKRYALWNYKDGSACNHANHLYSFIFYGINNYDKEKIIFFPYLKKFAKMTNCKGFKSLFWNDIKFFNDAYSSLIWKNSAVDYVFNGIPKENIYSAINNETGENILFKINHNTRCIELIDNYLAFFHYIYHSNHLLGRHHFSYKTLNHIGYKLPKLQSNDVNGLNNLLSEFLYYAGLTLPVPVNFKEAEAV